FRAVAATRPQDARTTSTPRSSRRQDETPGATERCGGPSLYGGGENSARTSEIGDSVNVANTPFVAPIFPPRRRLHTLHHPCRGRAPVLLRSRARDRQRAVDERRPRGGHDAGRGSSARPAGLLSDPASRRQRPALLRGGRAHERRGGVDE